jgi:putative addiction module component (TIGR02574 family)
MLMFTMTDIITGALELPRSDRSYLAAKLIESLEEEELSPEWREELDKRVARWKSGETQSVSSEDVHRKIGKILS